MSRTLSDSEARWEAAQLIVMAVDRSLNDGHASTLGEQKGWTDADVRAVEHHAAARAEGLLRRPRKATL